MNYRIDNLQYCKWSREIFEINNKAGLNAVHVTLVYHEDYDELQQRIKEWNKHFEENKDLIFLGNNYNDCLLYTSPSPRDRSISRMPSSA